MKHKNGDIVSKVISEKSNGYGVSITISNNKWACKSCNYTALMKNFIERSYYTYNEEIGTLSHRNTYHCPKCMSQSLHGRRLPEFSFGFSSGYGTFYFMEPHAHEQSTPIPQIQSNSSEPNDNN